MFSSGTGEGNLSGNKDAKLVRDLVCYTFLSLIEKKTMISHLLYRPSPGELERWFGSFSSFSAWPR